MNFLKLLLLSFSLLSINLFSQDYVYHGIKNIKAHIGSSSENFSFVYKAYPFENIEEQEKANWIDKSSNCGILENENYVSFWHGVYTCEKEFNKTFSIPENSDFDISFSAIRLVRGSNYYISFKLNEIFSFSYHRDKLEETHFNVSNLTAKLLNKSETLNYNHFRVTYINNTLSAYINDTLIAEKNNFHMTAKNNITFSTYVNNSEIVIKNIVVKIK